MKKRALGAGLDILQRKELSISLRDEAPSRIHQLLEIPLEKIVTGNFQPRQTMSEEALAELVASIQEFGVIEPIVVRQLSEGKYELVAGHRRFIAAKRSGLSAVPAIVRNISDEEALLFSLVENLQREDLTPLEEAEALARLAGEFGFTHQKIAEQVGKSRSYVTNSLRLLSLPESAKKALAERRLSRGQALALLAIPEDEREKVLKRILAHDLSVRDVEALAEKYHQQQAPSEIPVIAQTKVNRALLRISQQLEEFLGAKTRVIPKGDGGRIEIVYSSIDDLNRIVQLILPFEKPL